MTARGTWIIPSWVQAYPEDTKESFKKRVLDFDESLHLIPAKRHAYRHGAHAVRSMLRRFEWREHYLKRETERVNAIRAFVIARKDEILGIPR